MKNIFLLFCFFLPLFSTAQTSTVTVVPDARLHEVYEKDYLDNLVIENPFLIKRWNFYLDNAFVITDQVAGKTMDYPSVTISDIENVNILLLEKEQKIQKDWDKMVFYKIEGTTKILVYHPGKSFAKKLKKHLGE